MHIYKVPTDNWKTITISPVIYRIYIRSVPAHCVFILQTISSSDRYQQNMCLWWLLQPVQIPCLGPRLLLSVADDRFCNLDFSWNTISTACFLTSGGMFIPMEKNISHMYLLMMYYTDYEGAREIIMVIHIGYIMLFSLSLGGNRYSLDLLCSNKNETSMRMEWSNFNAILSWPWKQCSMQGIIMPDENKFLPIRVDIRPDR